MSPTLQGGFFTTEPPTTWQEVLLSLLNDSSTNVAVALGQLERLVVLLGPSNISKCLF